MNRKLQPERRLLRLLALLAFVATLAALSGNLPWPRASVLAAVALLAVVALADALFAWLIAPPRLTRDMPHAFALGHLREVAVVLANPGARVLALEIFDLHPECADSVGLPVKLSLAPMSSARVPYRLRFNHRGDFVLPSVAVRLRGPLGLFSIIHSLGPPRKVRVYPDFAAVARYALLAIDHRLSQLGIRQRPRRGEGLEFRQLREYRPGDALRQIDWKATARQHKPISRDYQDERDQQVFFLLDCGFRMRAQDSDASHFDAALNAMLLLSWVVLRQGDAVGCMTFAEGEGEGRVFLPAKGRDTMSRLMNGLFDVQPTGRTPDFRHLAARCAARLRKRSLLVLLTNLRDTDTDDLVAAVRLLGERHLVLIASLREAVLDDNTRDIPVSVDDALRLSATRLYLADHRQALARLGEARARVIDCTPQQLPVRLVNTYLDIKRGGWL